MDGLSVIFTVEVSDCNILRLLQFFNITHYHCYLIIGVKLMRCWTIYYLMMQHGEISKALKLLPDV